MNVTKSLISIKANATNNPPQGFQVNTKTTGTLLGVTRKYDLLTELYFVFIGCLCVNATE